MIDCVISDIRQFLRENKVLFFNERDFQIHLAFYLKQKDYDDVDVEYYVPYKVFGDEYIWENELKIDIVVSKDGEYCPIELKYKTKSVKNEPALQRFGTNINTMFDIGANDIKILKNQSAQDLGMYNFWKDVKRVELVKEKFNNVKFGVCVFLTNDTVYKNSGKPTSNNFLMSMGAGLHDRQRMWKDPASACARQNPEFTLSARYNIEWEQIEIENIGFNYTIIEI